MALTREIILAGNFDDAIVFATTKAKYHLNIFDKLIKIALKMVVFCVRPASTAARTCRGSLTWIQSLSNKDSQVKRVELDDCSSQEEDIELCPVVAWENELYVNVWTGPRIFIVKSMTLSSPGN